MAESSSHHRVFVYGTLMTGLRNHHYMDGAKFLGASQTLLPSYSMVQFPSVSSPGNVTPGIKKHGNHCIAGELYMVSDHGLEVLDQLEAVGVEYERGRVMLADGSQAWTYFLLQKKDQCPKGTPAFVLEDSVTQTLSWNGLEEERLNSKAKVAA